MASEVLKVSLNAGVSNSESVLLNGVNGHTYVILSIESIIRIWIYYSPIFKLLIPCNKSTIAIAVNISSIIHSYKKNKRLLSD